MVEQNGNESRVALLVVEGAVDDSTLPENAAALFGRYFSLDPVQVHLRANDEHELRVLRSELLFAPPRPTLRRPGFVLIQRGIDAMPAQLVGEIQDPLRVLVA